MSPKKQQDLPLVALTGATGFVGGRVLQKLLADGYRVKALVRSDNHPKAPQLNNVKWIKGELGDMMSEIALTSGADMVIHMAGLVTARTKDEYYRINSQAVGSLAMTANKQGVRRFVHLSSITARAPKLSHYAGSKRAGEGAFSRKLGKMKGVCVRAPAVFGTGDKATAPFYALIRKGVLPCPGGRNWRSRKISLIHVDDLATFLVEECLDGAYDGRTIAPSTRASLSWPEFANECALASGRSVRTLRLPLVVLYTIAAVTSVTKRVLGKGHLTLGKLREFLYEDWSVEADLQMDSDLQAALRTTILEDSP